MSKKRLGAKAEAKNENKLENKDEI